MAQPAPKNAIADLKTGLPTVEWLQWLQGIADAAITDGSGGGGGGTGGGSGGGGTTTIINNYGSGTPGKIAKWIFAQELTDSIISEAGGVITVTGTVVANAFSGSVNVSNLTGGPPNAFLLTNAAGVPSFSQTIPLHLIPTTTDTYDIGRADKLWRNAWISQINAITFAQTTQTLFGGYSTIGKNAGTFEAIVLPFETTVDFGQAMTVGDYVLVRAHTTTNVLTSEYLQVGSLVSGTRYNVTRDLASANAPDPEWPAGTPYLVLGTAGDGRIDLLAFDGKPRIVFSQQGSTPPLYSSQNVHGVVGNLNSYYGYTTDTYGAAFGDLTNGFVTVDPTNGVRLGTAGQTVVQLSAAGPSYFLRGITIGPLGSVTAGGVVLDASGLYINPVSASGGGTYANDKAVRWTTDLTYHTAIWRSDDTSASPFKYWNFDNFTAASGAAPTVVTYTRMRTQGQWLSGSSLYAQALFEQRTDAGTGFFVSKNVLTGSTDMALTNYSGIVVQNGAAGGGSLNYVTIGTGISNGMHGYDFTPGSSVTLVCSTGGTACSHSLSVGTTLTVADYIITGNNTTGTGTVYFGSAATAYLHRNGSGTFILNGGSFQMQGGFIYPARMDTAGYPIQGSWYLASNASYGLYTNTNMYCAGVVYGNGMYLTVNGTAFFNCMNAAGTAWLALLTADANNFTTLCANSTRLRVYLPSVSAAVAGGSIASLDMYIDGIGNCRIPIYA